MRVVLLSDHPGAMLRDAQRQRAAADRDMQLAHEDALARHRTRTARAREARDQARAEHRWGAWLRGVFAVWQAKRQTPAAHVLASQPTDEEERLAAGAAGERLVADQLGQLLDDEWTLLRGYRNRRGEIDHVLLGPRGLFAIEVKNQNATIDCHGDQWWSTKYDKYGNLVGPRREMSDRRGRSPSVQLNEPASQLEDFLRSRNCPATIGRVVVLTHPRAQLRSCTHPTVHICTSMRQIHNLLDSSRAAITATERAELERLIVRDHRFHEKRRSR
jgi:Nuclease-related domain